MSKNLKDIFETGRKRLTDLAEKRRELVERCTALKNGAAAQRLDECTRRILSLEDSTLEEIKVQLSAAEEMHRQAIVQISEDNDRHLSDIKQELEFRIAKISRELTTIQEWGSESANDKADQQLRALEHKYRSVVGQYQTATAEHLNDLDTNARRIHSVLLEEKDRLAGVVTGHIKEAKDKVAGVVEEITRQLHDKAETLEQGLNESRRGQAQVLTAVSKAAEETIASIKNTKTEEIAQLSKQVEQDLLNACETVVNEAVKKMSELSDECASELETSYQFSHSELTQTLTDLRASTNESIEQLKKLLDDAEQKSKARAEEIERNAKRSFEEALQARSLDLSSDSARAMLEEMIADLQKMSGQLSKQLNNSMQLHKERFATLLVTSEKTLSVSLDSMKFELDRMLEMHRVNYREKEQLLNSRLDSLERQYSRIMAGISDDI